jgi:hypothetical protein
MERSHCQSKWHETKTQDRLYQITSETECATAPRAETSTRSSSAAVTIFIYELRRIIQKAENSPNSFATETSRTAPPTRHGSGGFITEPGQ